MEKNAFEVNLKCVVLTVLLFCVRVWMLHKMNGNLHISWKLIVLIETMPIGIS